MTSGERPAPAPRAARRLHGLTILVVDDEPDVADTLGAILEHEGATVVTARSAGEALDSIDRARPDVVLSDLSLSTGEDSGFRLLARLRAHTDPRIARVPVIAVTGRLDYQAALYEVPFTARMLKPVDAQVLVSLVQQVAASKSE